MKIDWLVGCVLLHINPDRLFNARSCLYNNIKYIWLVKEAIAQSTGAVEYTDCTFAEGEDPPPNECPRYDTKQSDGEAPVMLELWRMESTLLLPSLPGSLWPRVIVPDRVLSMG